MLRSHNPPRHGEGDHVQHGAGGSPRANRPWNGPSITLLRSAVLLPVPERSFG